MKEHHKQTISKLVNEMKNDSRYLALIIGGSIAKGRELENSDVDVIVIATEEEFKRRQETKEFHYFRTDLSDYPDGYIDGSVVDINFLHEIAERGNEPSRAAFIGAFIAFSKIPELENVISKIREYQHSEQEQKIQSFYAHLEAMRCGIPEAEKRNDKYLLMWATNELVMYGGRMILAHNKILYPYHKWFMWELRNAKEKPDNLIEIIDTLLEKPSSEHSEQFCKAILDFRDWEKPPEGWVSRFREESEWHWRKGSAPIKDQ
ncbi:nucleotidyltransferase domain-containing protein [Cohnella silvisoli]|uniref:Nucleotidyltransferase domain-containing protein n=1 Tax=Cohnella silvisoli TaxID=2873699 RepID=A0ABV1L3Q8_9BACL|nr:nucleotidyltransferase domain-containing protein [Cohnella silvisoli]MCD9026185.1 nucleotidyltransferase domain-containing protein [Cohnella silvisoli]